MLTLEDKSKLISDFEEIYKFRKIIDKKFYKKCKKKCKKADMTQLKHAKSVLEEKKVQAGGNDVGISHIFSIASLSFAALSLLTDSILKKLTLDSNVNYFPSTCIIFMILITITFIVYMATEPSRRRNAYYYSIICDEIEKRDKMDQNI